MPNMFMLFLSFVYFFNILLFSTFSPFDCHRFHYVVVITIAVIYNNLGVLLDYRLVVPPIYNTPKEYKDYLRCCFLVLLVYLGLLSSGFYCAFCFHLLFFCIFAVSTITNTKKLYNLVPVMLALILIFILFVLLFSFFICVYFYKRLYTFECVYIQRVYVRIMK